MFSTKQEVQDFVNSHSPGYVEQWLHIWQPYFCKGVNKATRLSTTNTRLLMSYFQHRMSTSQAHLPRGYHSVHDGRDNDRPIDSIQSTIHRWIETVKTSSNR